MVRISLPVKTDGAVSCRPRLSRALPCVNLRGRVLDELE